MMQVPVKTVSIIIPLYNREGLIGETLASVCGQSYQNLEILLVDDGSTDSGARVVAEWRHRDRRVQLLVRDQVPKGAPSCRNLRSRECHGGFCYFS